MTLFKNKVVIDTFLLTCMTALAKISPVLIGFVISSQQGQIEYQIFISFILLANLLTSISSMGCTSQIISLDKVKSANSQFVNIVLIGILVLFLSFLTIYYVDTFTDFSGSLFNEFPAYSALLYAGGSSLVYMSTSRLNNLLATPSAALIWFFFSFINLLSVLIWFLLQDGISHLFYYMAIGTLLSGFFGFYVSAKKGTLKYSELKFFDASYFYKNIKNALFLSFFGFSTVGMFLYLQRLLVTHDTNGSLYFSLLVQVFSIVTFLPLIVGNVLIPKIKSKVSLGKGIYVFYSIIAVCILIPFIYFFESLASLYGIHGRSVNSYNSIVFSLIALIACVNSYTIQTIVANKKFKWLLLYSMLWCSIIMIYLYTKPHQLENILEAMLWAYSICSLVFYYIVSKKRFL